MPYKDKDLQRKYQKEWARRKNKGVETKGINPHEVEDTPTPLGKRITNNNYNANRVKRKNELKDIYLGSCCVICHRDTIKLDSHRKDGLEHKDFKSMTNKEFEDSLKSGDYVRLCTRCHKTVHWIMKHLNMNWKIISANLDID